MKILHNPFRKTTTPLGTGGFVKDDSAPVLELLSACPAYKPSPLTTNTTLDQSIKTLYFKDERSRMGLGSFKALGAAYVIAKIAATRLKDKITDPEAVKTCLSDMCFVSSSAGNHGLSLAAGARIFGAKSVIYLSETVPKDFATRLQTFGATVVIEGTDYDASLKAAIKAAQDNGWYLLSDTTWDGYTGGVDVMEGYLAIGAELETQITAPSHIFLQAGVGGLAGAMAAYARKIWGQTPIICVVEPDRAPALFNSIKAGESVYADGDASSMGRLDCKEPSLTALNSLARDCDAFMLLSDEFVETAITALDAHDLTTSPSGGAGYAGFVAAKDAGELALNADSRVLIILSECV